MKRKYLLLFGVIAAALYIILFGKKTFEVAKEIVSTMMKPKYAGGASPYDDLINSYAAKNHLDPMLVRAIIRQESNWDPDVPGFDGLSIGLMQITLPLAHDYFGRDSSFEELKDPETNIAIGTWYLGRMIQKFGTELGIAAYNEGPGNAAKGAADGGYNQGPYDDAKYVESVLNFYNQYMTAQAIPGIDTLG